MILTTAIYPNRIEDKKRVESQLLLQEFGNDAIVFYTPKMNIFARGYVRIVYGDHGPYIEFKEGHIIMELVRKFPQKANPKTHYYEWLLPKDRTNIKIYFQLRDVKDVPYAPGRGHRKYRKEGYADYKPGMYYVDPFELICKS